MKSQNGAYYIRILIIGYLKLTMHTQQSNDDLGALQISGIDAKKFLQGQLTCNLEEVTESQSKLGAHCNPQGRIISLFHIYLHQESYYLLMPKSLIPIAQAALKKYAVFFKTELKDVSDTINSIDLPIEKTWKTQAIANGIPFIYPETSEKFLPHEINLPNLGGVSFNKGCYTGQEIIARMQYRGKLKTHLYRAKTSSEAPPIRGADIYSNNEVAGTIVDYCQLSYNEHELLVIATETASNQPLSLDPSNTHKIEIVR